MSKSKRPKKIRRESGRVWPVLLDKENSYLMQWMWDDWIDYRDSFRYDPDRTHIRKRSWFIEPEELKRYNDKNKLLLKRREAMKSKEYQKSVSVFSRKLFKQ